jgi:hypothetical protein
MRDNDVTTSQKGNTMSTIKQKIRARRAVRQFERALDTASPAMRSELIAMAARQNVMR